MKKPIRVAQVMGYMNGGGVEQVVMNYYRHIDRTRVQFDLIVCEGSTLVPREEVGSLGGRVLTVPAYSDVLGFQRALKRLFAEQRWEIVHSHMNALSVFPLRAAKVAGVPIRIAHSHSTSGRGEYAKNAVKRVLRTQANRYPTHRFACSCLAGEWLFGDGAEFEVVNNALDLDGFSFDAEARAEARADLGLVGDQLAVLHVGRFMAQKNHAFLIDAFERLLDIRPDSVLLLVGTGEDRARVEASVRERSMSGSVKFLGQRDDVERLYMAADAFALPSLYEGLGLVGVEAQRAGLPCFLSDTITREVDLTGTVRFLPIGPGDAARVWAESLSAINTGNRLCVHEADFAGYNVDNAAAQLCARYEVLLEEVQ